MCLINSNPFVDGTVLPISIDDARQHSYGGAYMRTVLTQAISTLTLKQYAASRLGLCSADACLLGRLLAAQAYIELLYNQNAQYACWTVTVPQGTSAQATYRLKTFVLSPSEHTLLTCLLKGTGMDSTHFAPLHTAQP